MASIMQGDEYGIPIGLKRKSDGTVITTADVEEVEIVLGGCRKTYSGGEVTFDGEKWIYPLTQEESFTFARRARLQVRVKFSGGDVVGRFADDIKIVSSDSEETL